LNRAGPHRRHRRDGELRLQDEHRNMSSLLHDLLQPQRLTEVVDIGANPIDGDPPYKPMLDAGLCRVTGFEPQAEALAELLRKQGPNERYLEYAVGDGGVHTLSVCRASGMSSLLEPDPVTLELFGVLNAMGDVMRRVPVQTRRLDDVDEIACLDFLKIDVQGSEMAVFRSGTGTLGGAVAIQTEVSFITLYKNQSSLGDVDVELRGQGFVPHCFADIKTWPIAPCVINRDPTRALNQLLEADIVYVRDFSHPERMSDEQLKHLALIAHHCYESFDLALRCVMVLEQRGVLGTGAQQQYLTSLASRA
jgi:FkbM family methyltransferase